MHTQKQASSSQNRVKVIISNFFMAYHRGISVKMLLFPITKSIAKCQFLCDWNTLQAVLVHQLSKKASQNPFRKNKGRVIRAAFHPTKPFFFVATQNSVRIYNLAKQELSKKLLSGSSVITSLAVHPSGDHVIVGTEVSWSYHPQPLGFHNLPDQA